MRGREADVQDTLNQPDEAKWRWLPNYDVPDRRDKGRSTHMEQLRVFYDRTGKTLTVWFGEPEDEYICEETGDEVILMKDRQGHVIGFEKLNFSIAAPKELQVAVETVGV